MKKNEKWHPARLALFEAGVTQTAVADRAGVRPPSVNHMLALADRAPVSPKVRQAIVDALAEAGYGRRRAEALFK